MSPDIREAMLGRVDTEAARKRAGVEYVVGVIEANEAALRDAFIPEGTPEDEVPRRLYDTVTTTFDDLARVYTRSFGVILYSRPLDYDGQDVGVVRMGWGRFYKSLPVPDDWEEGKPFPFGFELTQEGVDVINGLRAAQGLESLQEQRQRGRQAWDNVIRAGEVKDEAAESEQPSADA